MLNEWYVKWIKFRNSQFIDALFAWNFQRNSKYPQLLLLMSHNYDSYFHVDHDTSRTYYETIQGVCLFRDKALIKEFWNSFSATLIYHRLANLALEKHEGKFVHQYHHPLALKVHFPILKLWIKRINSVFVLILTWVVDKLHNSCCFSLELVSMAIFRTVENHVWKLS